MKKYLIMVALLLAANLFVSSCSSYVQYLDIASDLPVEDSYYIFENNDCKVTFDFWKEYGSSSFTLYNKSNEGLYIDLNKCAMSYNGKSYPISSEDLEVMVDQNLSVHSLENDTYVLNNIEVNIPKGKHIICVAPLSTICINRGRLCTKPYKFFDYEKDCPDYFFLQGFQENESPLKFSFWIYYFFKENKESNVVKANFYVSEIENRVRKHSVESKKRLNHNQFITTDRVVKDSSPTRFYIKKTEEIH